MVVVEMVVLWGCRCQAMVWGSALRPTAVSFSRSSTIRATVASSVAFGEVFGRLERGSNAAASSARYRATSLETQFAETPYSRATSAWDRPWRMTAVMIRRAFDMLQIRPRKVSNDPRQ